MFTVKSLCVIWLLGPISWGCQMLLNQPKMQHFKFILVCNSSTGLHSSKQYAKESYKIVPLNGHFNFTKNKTQTSLETKMHIFLLFIDK